jgi:hypothetical protein
VAVSTLGAYELQASAESADQEIVTNRHASTVAALLALLALLAGCGSSKPAATVTVTQPTATTATQAPQAAAGPTKASFIHQADKECAHTNRRLKPVISRIVRLDLSTQPLAFRLAGYRDAFHDLGIEYEDLLSELRQLEAPHRDHRLVTRTMRLLDAIPLHLDRLQSSITNLDAVSFVRAEIKLNQTFIRLGGTADSYGFRVCGVVPGRHRKGSGPLPTAKNV